MYKFIIGLRGGGQAAGGSEEHHWGSVKFRFSKFNY